ncbi:cysteine desulfurase family protein [Paenibacillus sp. NRS-1760]|uniref:cysteine desulfurase family protein n=1 Tax=Paenibacillus sp. NRS-1760 TaxID=3233902 RepID=UPI003D29DB5A
MIYFDNSATTQVDVRVVDAMIPYLYESYGNPSSKYYKFAIDAKNAIEEARNHVSQLLCCETDEVIFTAGATESNNMLIKGVVEMYGGNKRHLVISKAEHSSVMETAKYLESKEVKVTYLSVDKFGRVNLNEFEECLEAEPTLISIQWGNNELGSLNDIEYMSKKSAERGIFFHTDATQVVGKVPVNLKNTEVRFLSCSAHKFHGPKGIGAAIIRKDSLGIKTKIVPLIHGGGQENEYRSGTHSVHNIVGFGKAAEIAIKEQLEAAAVLSSLEIELRNRLSNAFTDVIKFNSDKDNKIPGIVNVQFKGINNELLIKKISDRFAISTGSACSSSKPSHVLQSIGLSLNEVRSSVRISLSKTNTVEEIESFCNALAGK